MTVNTPVLGRDGCLALLRDEFTNLYPIFTRQVGFFEASKSAGQDAPSYMDQLASMSLEADVEQLDRDAITIFKFMSSCEDERLREKLFVLRDRNMAEGRSRWRFSALGP